MTGILSAVLIALAVMFFTDVIPQARQIKEKHPMFVIVAGFVLIIMTWHSLYTLIMIMAAAFGAVPVWFIHASLRSSEGLIDGSQSAKNHFASSPFGMVMQTLGLEASAYEKEQ